MELKKKKEKNAYWMKVRKPLRFEMSVALVDKFPEGEYKPTVLSLEGVSAQMRLSRAFKHPNTFFYLLVGIFFKFNGKLPRLKLLLEFYRRS